MNLATLFDKNVIARYDGWEASCLTGDKIYFFNSLTERQANMALNKLQKYPEFSRSYIFRGWFSTWHLVVVETQ